LWLEDGGIHPVYELACKKLTFFLCDILRTQGIYTRALCKKNEGSVEAKQRPVKMGDRSIYRALSP
jgi:hypothetical protein